LFCNGLTWLMRRPKNSFLPLNRLRQKVQNAHEAIDLHCETLIEDGQDIPIGRTIAQHQSDPEFAGWVRAAVDVTIEPH